MGELSKKIGRRIKEIRESKGIKQFELAEMLNMEPSNMTRIESGYQIPKEENLVKIAEILQVAIKDLFDFEHIQTKNDLIEKINNYLENFSQEEIEFVYKSVVNLKQLK